MILVDSNVLLYAVGSEHPHREPSRRLFDAVASGALTATTTPEVIQEFTHAYARRRPRRTAVAQARRFATLLSPLVSATETDLLLGLKLYEDNEALDAFDSVLAATAIGQRAEAFVSAGAAFASVRRLRHVAPGSPEFEKLIA